MQAPPSRYKVVERGRRLEVIDTHTGRPASVPHPPSSLSGQPRPGSGGSGFATQRWFDNKAPRTIRVNYAVRRRFANLRLGIGLVVALLVSFSVLFWPFVPILLIAALATPTLREQIRAASTRWIDALDQAA